MPARNAAYVRECQRWLSVTVFMTCAGVFAAATALITAAVRWTWVPLPGAAMSAGLAAGWWWVVRRRLLEELELWKGLDNVRRWAQGARVRGAGTAARAGALASRAVPAAGAGTRLIGYRTWIRGRDAQLRSAHIEAAWSPGVNTAVCAVHQDLVTIGYPTDLLGGHGADAPAWDCTCGLYAFSTPAATAAKVDALSSGLWILGAVELWGHVIEHEGGFRAQYGRVVALVGDPDIAATYHAASYPTLEALASEWPPPPPVQMAS